MADRDFDIPGQPQEPDEPRPPGSTIAPVARSTIGIQNVNTLSIFHVPVTKVTLKSVTFTSDHGVIKDNELDWKNSGALYKRPHWEVPAAGASGWPTSPVSHTKGTAVSIDVEVDVERRGIYFIGYKKPLSEAPVSEPPGRGWFDGTAATEALEAERGRGGRRRDVPPAP